MNDFEKRLKDDAGNIRSDISPELQRRLDATIEGTERLPLMPERAKTTGSLWLASSLTGLAAAIAVIALLNWDRGQIEPAPVRIADTPAVADQEEFRGFPLNARTADLTEPLEEELLNLQADLEKARESVEKDLRSTF